MSGTFDSNCCGTIWGRLDVDPYIELPLCCSASHTHFIQATDVITKTEMASRDTKRKPRAPPTRYSDYMSGNGTGAGCVKDDGDKELEGKIKMEGFSQKGATSRNSQVSQPLIRASWPSMSNYMNWNHVLTCFCAYLVVLALGCVALGEQIVLQYKR